MMQVWLMRSAVVTSDRPHVLRSEIPQSHPAIVSVQ